MGSFIKTVDPHSTWSLTKRERKKRNARHQLKTKYRKIKRFDLFCPQCTHSQPIRQYGTFCWKRSCLLLLLRCSKLNELRWYDIAVNWREDYFGTDSKKNMQIWKDVYQKWETERERETHSMIRQTIAFFLLFKLIMFRTSITVLMRVYHPFSLWCNWSNDFRTHYNTMSIMYGFGFV